MDTDASEFSQANDCLTIFPGDSCLIHVTYLPTSFGKNKAIMAIFSDDPAKPAVNVNLSGKTPPPKISVSPTSRNFGSITVGDTSASQTITIKNSGTSDLVISNITIMGTNADEFSQKSSCSTLLKSELCTIDVTFNPALPGKKSASIGISSNDPKKPFINVKLNGIGI